MYIYSTPVFNVRFHLRDAEPGETFDLHDFSEIHITFEQDAVVVDILNPEIIDNDVLRIHLTQEQTALFRANRPVKVQGNFVTSTGYRVPSEIVCEDTFDNLLRRIL